MSKGLLTINVVDYENFYAIKNAKVAIYYIHRETNELELLCDNLKTDESGQVRKIGLYAPNIKYSQKPEKQRPYSRYVVEVTKEGYDKTVISGIQVLPCIEAMQTVELKRLGKKNYALPSEYSIEEHILYGGYDPKIMENELKPTFVLSEAVVPEFIVVHDGLPTDKNAKDYWIYFSDYIKNVASSEIYATWPKSTIYANIIAIISFTLNRVYTEWYKNQGYRFTITSTTQFDHKFIYNRNTFDTINTAVDDIFNTYLTRGDQRQPLLTQYCDGKQTQCPGVMTQWGSKYLGDQGYSYDRILKYYYGNDIEFRKAPIISGIPTSYPGYDLTIGSRGDEVKTIQIELNVISKAYPAIQKVNEDGIYGVKTKESVEMFQKIFNLPRTGIVDFATWYEISRVYVAVSQIGSYQKNIF
ncbi:MAG: peptidoglycan-binding protein [Romboutsia sp.]|uniref:peptidoglycan-binding domain-containing protein n=1 Tax=Romboutsia sp. TaxID=1965302 RepID=UPI003F38B603